MYCIECGAPIEATARICGACRFPQPLEEFAELEPLLDQGGGTTTAQKPVFPVRLEEPPRKREHRPRVAAAIAVFVALCISTGLSVYLLTRSPAAKTASEASPQVPVATPEPLPSAPVANEPNATKEGEPRAND